MSHQSDEAAEIRMREQLSDKLVQVAMNNMTIPQAKVFAVKMQIYIDLYLEETQARSRQQVIQEIRAEMPKKRDEHPIDPETGQAVEVYGYEATFNEAIDAMNAVLSKIEGGVE